MDELGAIETVLPVNRRAVLTRLFLVCVVIGCVAYVLIGFNLRVSWLHVILLLAVCAYAIPPVLRLLFTGQAVVVTERGLIDRTGGVGFVKWDEIRGARVRPYGGLNLVELDLTDQEAVLARLGPIRRALLRYNIKRGGVRPNIRGTFVQGGAEAVTRLIGERARGSQGNEAV